MSPSVAFVVHGERIDARRVAEQAIATLDAGGTLCQLAVLTKSDEFSEQIVDPSVAVVVSLGGDGTFLRAAREAHGLDVPILGVNFGRVGYLLDLPPSELAPVVLGILEGSMDFDLRYGLEATVHHQATITSPVFAINEVSVEKTVPGHVARLHISIDGESFMTYSADGVLLATPMGSTAYNLSAGGPILAPGIDGFVLTPVAPHFAINRSIVLTGNQQVSLEVVGDRSAVCVVDGVSLAEVGQGDRVVVQRSSQPLKVVTLEHVGFGDRLRENLRQGHEE